jgi:PIN domain nuclease of toxin-antitoxin system
VERRSVIVLDTHAWVWWISDPVRLGRLARRQIEGARRVGLPAICCLEIATLAARRRISLDRPVLEWLHDSLARPGVDLLPLTPAVSVKAADFPADFPGDPADRIIVATAILESAPLVTKDERIQGYAGVRTIWS